MWSTAEVRPRENLEAFPSFTPTKRISVCLPCGNQGLSSEQVERDNLWDQENVVQSKNGMMPKLENMELKVTSRLHIQMVLSELGCHPLGGRLGHVFWEKAPRTPFPMPTMLGCSQSGRLSVFVVVVQSLSHVISLCDPIDCNMPGLPIHHQFPELTQTHVH